MRLACSSDAEFWLDKTELMSPMISAPSLSISTAGFGLTLDGILMKLNRQIASPCKNHPSYCPWFGCLEPWKQASQEPHR